MTTTNPTKRPTTTDHTPWLTRAWTAVALVPVFYVIAFAVGEGLYALTDYKPENVDAPVWIVIVVDLAVLAVALAPCVAAVLFGRRAVSTGDRRGAFPLIVGAVAGAAGVILTVVSEVGNLLR